MCVNVGVWQLEEGQLLGVGSFQTQELLHTSQRWDYGVHHHSQFTWFLGVSPEFHACCLRFLSTFLCPTTNLQVGVVAQGFKLTWHSLHPSWNGGGERPGKQALTWPDKAWLLEGILSSSSLWLASVYNNLPQPWLGQVQYPVVQNFEFDPPAVFHSSPHLGSCGAGTFCWLPAGGPVQDSQESDWHQNAQERRLCWVLLCWDSPQPTDGKSLWSGPH